VALGALTGAACAAGLVSGLVLALSSGTGGGGSETTAEGIADLTQPLTDRFIGALVIPNSVAVSGVEASQNGQPVPIDGNVSPVAQGALEQVLEQQGIFDPAGEYLQFWQTSAPMVVQDGDRIRVRLLQSENGQPVAQSRIGFGGSNESDLLDGLPLANFQGHDNPFAARVPTLGGTARAVLLVLLIAAAFLLIRAPRTARHA
jgi:hypothetical protein